MSRSPSRNPMQKRSRIDYVCHVLASRGHDDLAFDLLVVSYIKKENGKYCVRSEDNPDWNGGCYDTKEEAEERLREVEYFKNQG